MDRAPTPHVQLVELLREQEGLYDKLVGLSDLQRDAIEAGRSTELLEVLGQRQGIVEQIVVLSERLEPFRERFDELVSEMPEDSREEVRTRVSRLEELMRSITERDEDDRAVLQKHRESLAGSSVGARRSVGAVKAYGRPAPAAAPKFQDRQA